MQTISFDSMTYVLKLLNLMIFHRKMFKLPEGMAQSRRLHAKFYVLRPPPELQKLQGRDFEWHGRSFSGGMWWYMADGSKPAWI
jgi:hypothetical protein